MSFCSCAAASTLSTAGACSSSNLLPCSQPPEPNKSAYPLIRPPACDIARQEELAEETGVDGQHFHVLTLGKNLRGARLKSELGGSHSWGAGKLWADHRQSSAALRKAVASRKKRWAPEPMQSSKL